MEHYIVSVYIDWQMKKKKEEPRKELSMVDLLLNPHLMSKEQREVFKKINKARYDDMIARGLKPTREDFYGS